MLYLAAYPLRYGCVGRLTHSAKARSDVLVFINYNTRDRDKAQAVKAALSVRHPISNGTSPRSTSSGGAYWIPRLADTIARSDVVLFFAGREIGNWQELEYHEEIQV